MDYYQIIGVDEKATPEQINEAYRHKARLHHPDLQPEDQKEAASKKFKEVAEAFEVLSNPDKRQQYDFQNSGLGFPNGFNPFGWSPLHRGPMGRDRTKNISVNVTLSFIEAALGCRKYVTIQKHQPCTCTNGVSEWETCVTCRGSGRRTFQQAPFVVQTTCDSCGGSGSKAKTQCNVCSGKGHVGTIDEVVSVDIPPGVEDGLELVMSGMGEVAKDGRRGNLKIVIKVSPHPWFSRHGTNLFYSVPITYTQLIRGTEIEIPTLTGKAVVKVPPNTSAGKRIRIKAQGIPDLNNSQNRGDMYVILELDFPEPNEEYARVLDTLSELDEKYITNKRQEFKERLKNG
jgi:molecular chaperone DnaJ